MKKKFINAVIYKHDDASEIIIENGKFKKFGKDLDSVKLLLE